MKGSGAPPLVKALASKMLGDMNLGKSIINEHCCLPAYAFVLRRPPDA
jgi:hypothetical protein